MLPERRIRVPPELQHDRSTAVDHEVKPPVVPGHGEAFVGQGRGHPDPDEAHPVGGNHSAPDYCSSAEKQLKVQKLFVRIQAKQLARGSRE